MSCPPPQPEPNPPISDENEALSSDYGSDFSADEAELLNELLAKVDATAPVTAPLTVTAPAAAITPVPPPTAAIQGKHAVTDIEDIIDDASSRVPRVLGREKPWWQVKRFDLRAANKTQYGAGYSRTTTVEHPNSTEGRERQRERDIAREQANIEAAKKAESKENPVLDTRSPVERFRRPPNKAFSVTDLISPAWCEVQYWYTLTKHGRKRRTAAMKLGSNIHKTLEDEVYTTVPVEITTKEDALALRIWNVIQGLRTLREFGMTREFEIWGLVDGELVNGIIDQLSYECPDSGLEASAASHYAEIAASRAVLPEYQMSLSDFLLSPSHGGMRLSDLSTHEAEPQTAENPVSSQSSADIQHLPRIYLTDVKTRGSGSAPTVKSSAFRPTMMQLSLYYRMLNRMATSDDVTIELLCTRYGLDPKKNFTDAFICEVGSLNDRFFDALSSMEYDPDYAPTPEDAIRHQASHSSQSSQSSEDSTEQLPTASQDSTSVLLAHSNLTSLWTLMKSQLRATFLPPTLKTASCAPSIPSEFQPSMLEEYPTILSPLLTARYISSKPTADLRTKVLGDRSFLFDPTSLQSYIDDQMNWWRGERTPRGVEVMEAWKCRICEFKDECEWRQEREWAYANRRREPM